MARLRELDPVVQVSLHASNPKLSGLITRAERLWGQKIEGVTAALDNGLRLAIGHVTCRPNLDDLNDFVRFVTALPGFHEHLPGLLFSLVVPTGRARKRARELVPRYREAAPALLAAMSLAADLGAEPQLMEACSVPVCIEPKLQPFLGHLDDKGEVGLLTGRTRIGRCHTCEALARCPGIPSLYPELFGTEEFELDG